METKDNCTAINKKVCPEVAEIVKESHLEVSDLEYKGKQKYNEVFELFEQADTEVFVFNYREKTILIDQNKVNFCWACGKGYFDLIYVVREEKTDLEVKFDFSLVCCSCYVGMVENPKKFTMLKGLE